MRPDSSPLFALIRLAPPADAARACRDAGAEAALEKVKRTGGEQAKSVAEWALEQVRG